MLKQVIVPLDGSPLAEAALPYATQVAQGLKLHMELLRVIEPTSAELKRYAKGETKPLLPAEARARAMAYLKQAAGSTGAGSVTTKVKSGVPAVEIIDTAEEYPDALIVMSTHGRSGVTRWLIGSVAEKVLHFAPNPILLVRPKATKAKGGSALRSIVVPLDGSALAEQALPHAMALAQGLGLEIVLVRATPTLASYPAMSEISAPAAYAQVIADMQAEAKDYLAKVGARLRKQGIEKLRWEIKLGDAAGAIIDAAADGALIVMTSRGRTGFKRAVLGSVADRIVRHANTPVYLVKAG